ncbi:MAG: hypothetical protein AAB953_00375, partial [Patescibacteria group bacterium]
EYPALFEKVLTFMDLNDLTEEAKNVYNNLTEQYNAARGNFQKWDFDSGILSENRGKIDVLRLYAEDKYRNFLEDALGVEVEKLVDRIKKDRKNRKLGDLQLNIAEAEKAQQKDRLNELLKEQQKLLGT